MWWAYTQGGGLIFGGAYSRRFTVLINFRTLPGRIFITDKANAKSGQIWFNKL